MKNCPHCSEDVEVCTHCGKGSGARSHPVKRIVGPGLALLGLAGIVYSIMTIIRDMSEIFSYIFIEPLMAHETTTVIIFVVSIVLFVVGALLSLSLMPDRLWRKTQKWLFRGAFLLCLLTAGFSGYQIITNQAGDMESEKEYKELIAEYKPPNTDDEGWQPVETYTPVTDSDPAVETTPGTSNPAEPRPRDPAVVNSDYIGWLEIKNAGIDYPVVRNKNGHNNDKYLYTTFAGKPNRLGAIFAHYSLKDDFHSRHVLIYGHNARNRTMFGNLREYLLKSDYMESHRDIIVTLPDGSSQKWRVFAAKKTTTDDPVYGRLTFSGDEDFAKFAKSLGAPDGTTQILTLTTCVSGNNKNERYMVHASLVGIK